MRVGWHNGVFRQLEDRVDVGVEWTQSTRDPRCEGLCRHQGFWRCRQGADRELQWHPLARRVTILDRTWESSTVWQINRQGLWQRQTFFEGIVFPSSLCSLPRWWGGSCRILGWNCESILGGWFICWYAWWHCRRGARKPRRWQRIWLLWRCRWVRSSCIEQLAWAWRCRRRSTSRRRHPATTCCFHRNGESRWQGQILREAQRKGERKDREVQPHDRSEETEAHRAEVKEQMFEMRHHRALGRWPGM